MNANNHKPGAVNRRQFIALVSGGMSRMIFPERVRGADVTPPTSNPVAHLGLAWTDEIRWDNIVDLTQVRGKDILEKLACAQAMLAVRGGGVIYFPAGVYRVPDTIRLKDGIVLRGADPISGVRARDETYAPPSRLEFPRYVFSDRGDGTPLDTAFNGIHLEDPAHAANCGVVNLDIDHGHILFGEGANHHCGRNRLVFGCRLRHAALPNKATPDLALGQKPWQRYTATWDHAAIQVFSGANAVLANNRLPCSGEGNFTMNGYVMQDRKKRLIALDGVVFDYDNRAGIYLNHYAIGGPGGQGPDGTPESHPWGFCKGLVICDNYVFNTGRCAIGFCGDGVICTRNLIRFVQDIWRPTVTGRQVSHGASTNDNRAVEMRGWRWVVEHNEYEVYRNLCCDRKYYINDGEGMMHEDHVNSTVRDSTLRRNRGNAYISIYHTAGIDGLAIEENEIRLDRAASKEPAIHVTACRVNHPFPCRNVRILNNSVTGDILISGVPGQNNIIRGNRALGTTPLKIRNQANAMIEDNVGFEVENIPWTPHAQREGRAQLFRQPQNC